MRKVLAIGLVFVSVIPFAAFGNGRRESLLVRFRGAIGPNPHWIQGSFSADRYGVQKTEPADPMVGCLLIGAANFDEATEIAAGCPR